MSPRCLLLAGAVLPGLLCAQQPAAPTVPALAQPAPTQAVVTAETPAAPSTAPFQFEPTWETQKLAHTYTLSIPAPRGQITDRNGLPLAQTRMAQNLAINFPTPPKFTDDEARRFIAEQVALAARVLQREVAVDPAKALKYYKTRGVIPLTIVLDLKPAEIETFQRLQAPGLLLQPIYQRYYPQGKMAGHIVGYVGRQGRYPEGPVENNETMWPPSEGREGLELTFNEQLTGKNGMMHLSFDNQGHKAAEKVLVPPTPGQNIVTTLDLKIQRMVEDSLIKAGRPSAMVVLDANTGEILAMASMPSYDPNTFIPLISPATFQALNNDPAKPLIPRAFRSAYPPGSTFKVVTGLAAMNAGDIEPEERFGGESVIEINGRQFHNWKKHDVGELNFVEALTQSCNTYFYKMGLKTGPKTISEYAQRLGVGSKTGIPINSEDDGNLMDSAYMMKTHKRSFMPGDTANLSIGQGDTLMTPLQMAELMATVGNGGTVYQVRLVLQVQSIENKISAGYDIRARDQIDIDEPVMKALREGLIGVVSSASGTAGRASAPNVQVAGKTGTAQWGAGKNEKVAAWFAGFAPAENPKYAFATVYEGVPGDHDVHGGTYAAPIVGRVMKELFKDAPKEKKKKPKVEVEEDEADQRDPRDDPPPPSGGHRRFSSSPDESN